VRSPPRLHRIFSSVYSLKPAHIYKGSANEHSTAAGISGSLLLVRSYSVWFQSPNPQRTHIPAHTYTHAHALSHLLYSKCAEGGLNQIPPWCEVSGDIRMTPFYGINEACKTISGFVDAIDVEKLPTNGGCIAGRVRVSSTMHACMLTSMLTMRNP